VKPELLLIIMMMMMMMMMIIIIIIIIITLVWRTCECMKNVEVKELSKIQV